MIKMKTLVLTALLAVGLSGCNSMSSTVDGETHVFIGKQFCPTLLEMDRGQTLEVVLDENPSTGYVWALSQAPTLFKAEEIYKPTEQQPAVLGAGGQKIYRFTALEAGSEELHIQHKRAWEQTAVDEWKCRVRIS